MQLERLRLDQIQASRRLEELAKEFERERARVHHRIDKIELRLLLYSLGGSAAGALLGSAGSAAARTLIGG